MWQLSGDTLVEKHEMGPMAFEFWRDRELPLRVAHVRDHAIFFGNQWILDACEVLKVIEGARGEYLFLVLMRGGLYNPREPEAGEREWMPPILYFCPYLKRVRVTRTIGRM